MIGPFRCCDRLAACSALLAAGCSLADFDYLSADYKRVSAGGAAGDLGTAGTNAPGGSAGSGAAAGTSPRGGGGASSGAGSGGSAGSGGAAIEAFFCDSKYFVFDAAAGEEPIDALPQDGEYVIQRQGLPRCLITPDWVELGDSRYWAITRDCGVVGSDNPPAPEEVWHLEWLCSDVYRITLAHGTPQQRQLGLQDVADVGTPLYSVEGEATLDPSMLFHLRYESLDADLVRWRFSPVIQLGSCVEESGMAHYGSLDVMRVVIYPCTGSLQQQSWNLLPVPP